MVPPPVFDIPDKNPLVTLYPLYDGAKIPRLHLAAYNIHKRMQSYTSKCFVSRNVISNDAPCSDSKIFAGITVNPSILFAMFSSYVKLD